MSSGKIIISRTDSIGDVTLTLPVAGAIKKHMPGAKVVFLGRTYTEPVVSCCKHVDEFLNWDELSELPKKKRAREFKSIGPDVILHVFPEKDIAFSAEKARVPLRIGTGRRWYNLLTCNHLLNYSRRKSNLHEAQLNLKLLQGMDLKSEYSKAEIPELYGLNNFEKLEVKDQKLIDENKFNLILHPKSKGSAREWELSNYNKLIELLPEKDFKIFVSGTKEDGKSIKGKINFNSNVIDITGRFSLPQFISFINSCDGLIAASTGPLHIASAAGKHSIGLFSPMRPIHPGRWAPLGKNAQTLVYDENCPGCKKKKECDCINKISPKRVKEALIQSIS